MEMSYESLQMPPFSEHNHLAHNYLAPFQTNYNISKSQSISANIPLNEGSLYQLQMEKITHRPRNEVKSQVFSSSNKKGGIMDSYYNDYQSSLASQRVHSHQDVGEIYLTKYLRKQNNSNSIADFNNDPQSFVAGHYPNNLSLSTLKKEDMTSQKESKNPNTTTTKFSKYTSVNTNNNINNSGGVFLRNEEDVTHRLNQYLKHLKQNFNQKQAISKMYNIFDRKNRDIYVKEKSRKKDGEEILVYLKKSVNPELKRRGIDSVMEGDEDLPASNMANSQSSQLMMQQSHHPSIGGTLPNNNNNNTNTNNNLPLPNNNNNNDMNFVVVDEFVWEFSQNLKAAIKGQTKKQIKTTLKNIQGYNKQIEQFLFIIKDEAITQQIYDFRVELLDPHKLKEFIIKASEDIINQQEFNLNKQKSASPFPMLSPQSMRKTKAKDNFSEMQSQISLQTNIKLQKSNFDTPMHQSNMTGINIQKSPALPLLEKRQQQQANNHPQQAQTTTTSSSYIDKQFLQKLHYYNRYLDEMIQNKAEEMVKIKQQDFTYYNQKLYSEAENYIHRSQMQGKSTDFVTNLLNENKNSTKHQKNSGFILRQLDEIEQKFGKLHIVAPNSRYDSNTANKILGSLGYRPN